jgi:opacity protein-like surface antigen
MVRQFIRILSAATVAIVAGHAGVAAAADMPARVVTKAPAPVVVAFDWTGLYLGGYAAYLRGTVRGDPGHLSATGSITDNGWALGVFGGYRYQFQGGFVLGAHRNVQTTIRFYCGLETTQAGALFGEMIGRLVGQRDET